MGIIELINKIDERTIKIQSIQSSMIKYQDKKRTADTEITIATTETNTNNLMANTGKVGLIVWIERDDYDKYLK